MNSNLLQGFLVGDLGALEELDGVLGALQARRLDSEVVAQLLDPPLQGVSVLHRRRRVRLVVLRVRLAPAGRRGARQLVGLLELHEPHLEVLDLDLGVRGHLLGLHEELLVLGRGGVLLDHVVCAVLDLALDVELLLEVLELLLERGQTLGLVVAREPGG